MLSSSLLLKKSEKHCLAKFDFLNFVGEQLEESFVKFDTSWKNVVKMISDDGTSESILQLSSEVTKLQEVVSVYKDKMKEFQTIA